MVDDMQAKYLKITALLKQRTQDYEHATNTILNSVDGAVQGIHDFFLKTNLHIIVEDVTIIKDIMLFTVNVANTSQPQMFHVGVPVEIMLINDSNNVVKFLQHASEEAQRMNMSQQMMPEKHRLH